MIKGMQSLNTQIDGLVEEVRKARLNITRHGVNMTLLKHT